MKPVVLYDQSDPGSTWEAHRDRVVRVKALGEIGQNIACDLSLDSTRFHDAGYDHIFVCIRFVVVLARHYSRISSTNRFFNFMPAARSKVRIARAVLPCLPMTFPRS